MRPGLTPKRALASLAAVKSCALVIVPAPTTASGHLARDPPDRVQGWRRSERRFEDAYTTCEQRARQGNGPFCILGTGTRPRCHPCRGVVRKEKEHRLAAGPAIDVLGVSFGGARWSSAMSAFLRIGGRPPTVGHDPKGKARSASAGPAVERLVSDVRPPHRQAPLPSRRAERRCRWAGSRCLCRTAAAYPPHQPPPGQSWIR